MNCFIIVCCFFTIVSTEADHKYTAEQNILNPELCHQRDEQIQPDARDLNLIERVQRSAGHRIVFHHIFKTGGHALCQMANENDETPFNFISKHIPGIDREPPPDADVAERLKSFQDDPEHQARKAEIMSFMYQAKLSTALKTCDQLVERNPRATFQVQEYWLDWRQNCSYRDYRNPVIITLSTLRNPISRLASSSAHQARVAGFLTAVGTKKLFREMTPRQMTELKYPHAMMLDNYQIRRFVGKIPMKDVSLNEGQVNPEDVRKITKKDLDLAISLSNSFDILIPTERFCEAAVVFEQLFGWDPATFRHTPKAFTNAHNKLTNFKDAPAELLEKNKYDLQFWQHANKRFDQLLAALGAPKTDCPPVEYNYISFDDVTYNENVKGSSRFNYTRDSVVCTKHSLKENYD